MPGEETVPHTALPGEDVTCQAFHEVHDDTRAVAVPAWRRIGIPGMMATPYTTTSV